MSEELGQLREARIWTKLIHSKEMRVNFDRNTFRACNCLEGASWDSRMQDSNQRDVPVPQKKGKGFHGRKAIRLSQEARVARRSWTSSREKSASRAKASQHRAFLQPGPKKWTPRLTRVLNGRWGHWPICNRNKCLRQGTSHICRVQGPQENRKPVEDPGP